LLSPDGQSTYAYGINDAGQVVGRVHNGSAPYHAALWENGTMSDLGTLGGDFGEALAINNAGQIVGRSTDASGATRAFLWEDGTMTDLGTLPWDSGTVTDLGILPGLLGASAYDINDAVQMVGYSGGRDLPWSAVMWTLVPAEVHDVAVTSASAAPVSGNVGTPVSISATVQNQGNQPESFWVWANATGWSASQFVENLSV